MSTIQTQYPSPEAPELARAATGGSSLHRAEAAQAPGARVVDVQLVSLPHPGQVTSEVRDGH